MSEGRELLGVLLILFGQGSDDVGALRRVRLELGQGGGPAAALEGVDGAQLRQRVLDGIPR